MSGTGIMILTLTDNDLADTDSVDPGNIHTPPWKVFCFKSVPPPLWKFHFSFRQLSLHTYMLHTTFFIGLIMISYFQKPHIMNWHRHWDLKTIELVTKNIWKTYRKIIVTVMLFFFHIVWCTEAVHWKRWKPFGSVGRRRRVPLWH